MILFSSFYVNNRMDAVTYHGFNSHVLQNKNKDAIHHAQKHIKHKHCKKADETLQRIHLMDAIPLCDNIKAYIYLRLDTTISIVSNYKDAELVLLLRNDFN